MEGKYINKESKHRRNTLFLKSPPSKRWPEMPKGKLKTCFASRLRGETKEDMANKKGIGRNGSKCLIYGREKGRRR